MKRQIIILIGCVIFSVALVCGQKFSSVDFDSIRTVLQSDTSVYRKLISRLRNFDSTLSTPDLKLAYYGQVFQKEYSPYSGDKDADEFREKYNSGNYVEALVPGERAVKNHPLDAGMLYKLAMCYKASGNELMRKRVMRMFTRLLDVIEHSGDGFACETAIVVTAVADEYVVLGDYELEYESQTLTGNCDMFKVQKSDKFPRKKIYFNTYWSLKKMADLLKEEK